MYALMDVSDMGKHVPVHAIGLDKKLSPASGASNMQQMGNAQITSMVNPACPEETRRPLIVCWLQSLSKGQTQRFLLHTLAIFCLILTDTDSQVKFKHCSHKCTHRQTL